MPPVKCYQVDVRFVYENKFFPIREILGIISQDKHWIRIKKSRRSKKFVPTPGGNICRQMEHLQSKHFFAISDFFDLRVSEINSRINEIGSVDWPFPAPGVRIQVQRSHFQHWHGKLPLEFILGPFGQPDWLFLFSFIDVSQDWKVFFAKLPPELATSTNGWGRFKDFRRFRREIQFVQGDGIHDDCTWILWKFEPWARKSNLVKWSHELYQERKQLKLV